jgi:hypothetical protein
MFQGLGVHKIVSRSLSGAENDRRGRRAAKGMSVVKVCFLIHEGVAIRLSLGNHDPTMRWALSPYMHGGHS